jgi:hypothetical protein
MVSAPGRLLREVIDNIIMYLPDETDLIKNNAD